MANNIWQRVDAILDDVFVTEKDDAKLSIQIVPLYILLVPMSSCADIRFIPLQKEKKKRSKRKTGTK